MVEIKYKEEQKRRKSMSYQYLLVSTVIPYKAEKVSEKYNNIFSAIKPYSNFALDPCYKNVKKLLKTVHTQKLSSDFSIVYRRGLIPSDFYFWVGFLHGFDYDWDDRTNSIKPFSLVFFDTDVKVMRGDEQIAHYSRIHETMYLDIMELMDRKTKIIVDLNKECNCFFLGYLMKKVPWSWARKYVRVVLPEKQEEEKKPDKEFKQEENVKQVCEVFFRDVCYTSPLQKLINRIGNWIRNLFHGHDKQ